MTTAERKTTRKTYEQLELQVMAFEFGLNGNYGDPDGPGQHHPGRRIMNEQPKETKAKESRQRELVLKELENMPQEQDRWVSDAGVFKEHVEHPIKGEESNLFISAEKAMDSDEIQQIMKQFR